MGRLLARRGLRRPNEPVGVPFFLDADVVLAKLLGVVPELFGNAVPYRANFIDYWSGGRP
jgi:hypothetical protein